MLPCNKVPFHRKGAKNTETELMPTCVGEFIPYCRSSVISVTNCRFQRTLVTLRVAKNLPPCHVIFFTAFRMPKMEPCFTAIVDLRLSTLPIRHGLNDNTNDEPDQEDKQDYTRRQ